MINWSDLALIIFLCLLIFIGASEPNQNTTEVITVQELSR